MQGEGRGGLLACMQSLGLIQAAQVKSDRKGGDVVGIVVYVCVCARMCVCVCAYICICVHLFV